MRYFLDTEFIEAGNEIHLLSIGIVNEFDETYYAVSSDCDQSLACKWVEQNVIPYLGEVTPIPRTQIAIEIIKYLSFPRDWRHTEFWTYYGAYDWVAFSQLFGRGIDLPEGLPMFTHDIMQLCSQRGYPTLPKQKTQKHNALNDAHWTREIYQHLQRMSK